MTFTWLSIKNKTVQPINLMELFAFEDVVEAILRFGGLDGVANELRPNEESIKSFWPDDEEALIAFSSWKTLRDCKVKLISCFTT